MDHHQPPCLTAAVLAGALLAFAAPGFPGSPEVRAWVLDTGAQSLIHLALPSAERLATLTLGDAPEFLIESPDGSRLIVLDRGPGKDEGDRGYQAKGRSRATIVDTRARSVVASVDLGWGVDGRHYFFSEDGRYLTILCPGYADEDPDDALPRELVTLDVSRGAAIGRVTVDHGATPIGSDGHTLLLIRGDLLGSGPDYGRGSLSIVDLEVPKVVRSARTGGWFALDADGTFVYLLQRGRPSTSSRIHRNGTLLIYPTEEPEDKTVLDAGSNPRGLFRDPESRLFFIPADCEPGSKDGSAGVLRVVRDGMLAATLDVAAHPRTAIRKGRWVFVLGEEDVTLIDPARLQVAATIPLRKGKKAIVDDDHVPTQLDLSPDGRRAFISYGLHNRLAILDLETMTAVGSAKVGRRNKSVLTALSFGLQMGGVIPGWPGDVLAAAGAGAGLWNQHGGASRLAPRMLAAGREGRFAYVVNNQGRDLAVVDATSASIVKQIGVRGRDVRILGGGKVLAVLSESEIHLIDTRSNSKIEKVDIPGLRRFESTPDGTYAVALGKGLLLCLDSSSGDLLGQLSDLQEPTAVAFEGVPRRAGQESAREP